MAVNAPGCPVCGQIPSMTQFVFYPRFHKLRCRGCRTELKYRVPLWKMAISALLTSLAFLTGLVILVAVIGVASGATFWVWFGLYVVVLMLIASYVDAAYVLKRYPPVKAESHA